MCLVTTTLDSTVVDILWSISKILEFCFYTHFIIHYCIFNELPQYFVAVGRNKGRKHI